MNNRELFLRRSIPLIINSFNQFTYLKNIVEHFIENRFRNIYIFDHGSSYPKLVKYLSNINRRQASVLPIFIDKNNGPQWFFSEQLYNVYSSECILYTDPDMIFDQLADDFVSRMIDISRKYTVAKVGSALSLTNINNISITINDKEYKVLEWESQFWKTELEPNIFSAPVDTTLHLFNKSFYKGDFYRGVRIAGSGYEVQHGPWMVKDIMPKSEKKYYKQCKSGTEWGWWIK